MNNDEVKKLHKYLLDIFNEFSRICDKHDLKYFSIAGTTLGAVRHNGFIPWDDDLDVGMPIKDFMRLREIAKKDLKSPYNFIDTLNKNRNNHYFYKIENENTTFIESENITFKKGIWIDIMPFSGVPDNDIALYFFLKKAYFYLKFDSYINTKFSDCKMFKQKFFKVLSYIFLFNKDKTYYIRKFEKLMCKYDFNKCNRIFYAWKLQFSFKNTKRYTIFESSIFKKTVSHEFEGINMKIPSGYDSYLKQCYGDYMKIPKKEKRVTHKPYVLDFNNSYKNYEKRS